MLKSSSLCLYSSNLSTFWLKIEQFWPFEEISIFSNGGHLGWRAWLSDITFKGNPLRMIQAKFGLNWPSDFRGEDFFKSFNDGRQGGSPLKIVSVSAVLYPRWPPLLKIEISSNGQNCSILSHNVPKFELYKHNDELFNIYYGIFMNFELLSILTDYAN
jgi:hypothetical protein